MKSAIVTGADGFIGANLLQFFARHNVEVWALVLQNSPTLDRIAHMKHVNIVECDFSNLRAYLPILPKEADAFYHLAWQGVAPQERNLMERQIGNIPISLEALRLAKECAAKRFILPGSTMEYLYYGQPIDEKATPSPQDAYGAAKLSVRFLCGTLAKSLGQPFIYAVLTGVYGGDRLDDNVISYTIKSLLKGEQPKLTELRQLWDYIHINDLVEAFYCIGAKGKDAAFYAIGHGDNWPLSNYIYKIRDIINPELPLGIGEIPDSSERLPSSCVDLSSLYEDTGFVPQISFETGIVDVIERIKHMLLQ